VDELRRRLERAPQQTYYELLDVPEDAQKSTIQSAFLGLAKDWHPDRLPPALADYRELAGKLFSRYTAAHQVLSDDARRAEYAAKLSGGKVDEDERELVEQALRATTYFQKAEVLLRKHDIPGAREYARLAMENDPDQVDYLAFHVWVEAQDPSRLKTHRYDDLVKMLSLALKDQENHKQARTYRAQLLKRSGRAREALRDFRWLAENDRHNVEARREIRLYEMRRKTGDSAGTSEAPAGRTSGAPSKKKRKGTDVGDLLNRFLKKK
jgi:DnaJ-domain-containing protein 1